MIKIGNFLLKVERYKRKSLEKDLYMSFYIYDISEREMKKEVIIEGETYYIESEDDLVSIVHELVKRGFTVKEIAYGLGISEKKVRKYLEDCW
ncbi:hypothetical protein [Sulfolobus islandicus rod-shaped virus 3]|uniref:Uncharacterized protein n=1 Tax=Sulfolobus islandicus rod-shaped virus 3 TaxID=2848124 RepID=A0A1B3SN45_9VIRU|nr:terminase small subunit [Sulfolobus islandicus rudivirus 3]AOG61603.1 hypothetical protein [Sulfolobus islandicus rod-shaped virus 3]